MNLYAIIPFTAIIINVILMTYVFAAGLKTGATRAYVLFVASITLWELSELFLLAPFTPQTHIMILKLTAPLYLSPGFLFLNFVKKLTNSKIRADHYFFMFSVSISVFLAVFTDLYIKNDVIYFAWGLTVVPGLLFFYVFPVVILIPAIYSIIILAHNLIKPGEKIFKRQIAFVAIGLFIAIITGLTTNIVLPYFFNSYSIPFAASSLLAIQSVFMSISIIKYRFLTPTIKDFAYNLFSQINDGVAVLNWRGCIIEINEHALNIISKKHSDIIGNNAADIFPFSYTFDEDFTNREAYFSIEGGKRSVVISQISLWQSKLFLGKLIVMKDISGQLRMEEELVKASKIESLGVLAGGIAHDFNNLLTAIAGNISLARMEVKNLSERNRILEDAEKASLRAKNLTHQLLTFSKGGAPIKKIISTRTIIEDTAAFVLSGSAEKCRVNISSSLFNISADEGQISQVLHNIILNAVQSMEPGSTIELDADNLCLNETDLPPLAAGDYVKISVTDKGRGIQEKDLPFIFDPFYTTKKTGTGLGLAISYSIIKRHGGLITVNSIPGKGSKFTIILPAVRQTAAAADGSPAAVLDMKGRILLMDDEADVLKVGVKMLQLMGFDTATAVNGNEAVEIYHAEMKSGRRFDCVILDLTIPGGMGGKMTIQKLIEIDSDVVAIVTSGYSNDPVMAGYQEYGFAGILTKPFTFIELQKILTSINQIEKQKMFSLT